MGDENPTTEDYVLRMTGVSKRFPGVLALDNVDFHVAPGEVVILVGENGAGKSTLMKIIAGVHQCDSGSMVLDGNPVSFANPYQAKQAGVSIVYQEQALIPDLTGIENIFVTDERTMGPHLGIFAILDKSSMRSESQRLISDAFQMKIPLETPVRDLPLVERQIIEIIRAIKNNARILILDEPTSTLEDVERDHLFSFINKVKELGVGIVYCSHYIEECIEIGDRIVTLRDGRKTGEVSKKAATVDGVIEMMIGKSIAEQYPKAAVPIGSEPILRVQRCSLPGYVKEISFDLHPGEILGIAGLVGSGKSLLARAVAGVAPERRGRVSIEGTPLPPGDVGAAMDQGLVFLPADRKGEGLFLDETLRYNVSIANLKSLLKPWIRGKLEKDLVTSYMDKIRIKATSDQMQIKKLSGGNQQKAMIARWLSTKPRILVFEEPTRGIDVNAKVEVYQLIGEFVSSGGGAILVSSEVQELEGICDRVLVLHAGRLTAELSGNDVNKEKITYYSVTAFNSEETQ